MPNLRELTIWSHPGNTIRDLLTISTLPLPGLRSLYVLEYEDQDYPFSSSSEDEEEDVLPADPDTTPGSQPPVLFTGLVELEVRSDSSNPCLHPPTPDQQAQQQSQLNRVLQGSSSLQYLRIEKVQEPGATTLAGLTSLTHLKVGGCSCRLVLPSVHTLELLKASSACLESLDAPQLRSLKTAIFYHAGEVNTGRLERVCASRALKHCRDLTLHVADWDSQITARAMTVLNHTWHPAGTYSSGRRFCDSADSSSDSECKLCIDIGYCSQQVLALVPPFITNLGLT
jgi:hypothetical protein